MPGLWGRMEALSVGYQAQRLELETIDLTVLDIRALLEMGQCASWASCASHGGECWEFTSAQLAEKSAELIKAEGESWIDSEARGISLRIGHTLSKMRLHRRPRSGGNGPRIWHVRAGDLASQAQTYGLCLAHESKTEVLDPYPDTGPSGPSGTLAQGDGASAQADLSAIWGAWEADPGPIARAEHA